MRVVLQRVLSASVSVNSAVISSINRGLVILVGIAANDTVDDLAYMIHRVLNVRVFEDETGTRSWSRSVMDCEYDVLCVSQFTLYGSTTKNKPDFRQAMKSEQSKEIYGLFVRRLRESYVEDRIKDGVFGAMMNVSLVNEGPVTLELDSRKFAYMARSDNSVNDSSGKSNIGSGITINNKKQTKKEAKGTDSAERRKADMTKDTYL